MTCFGEWKVGNTRTKNKFFLIRGNFEWEPLKDFEIGLSESLQSNREWMNDFHFILI